MIHLAFKHQTCIKKRLQSGCESFYNKDNTRHHYSFYIGWSIKQHTKKNGDLEHVNVHVFFFFNNSCLSVYLQPGCLTEFQIGHALHQRPIHHKTAWRLEAPLQGGRMVVLLMCVCERERGQGGLRVKVALLISKYCTTAYRHSRRNVCGDVRERQPLITVTVRAGWRRYRFDED